MRSPFDSLLIKRMVGSGKLVRRPADRSRVEEVIVRRVRALVPERLNLTWHEPDLLLGPTVKSAYLGSSARGEVNPSGVRFCGPAQPGNCLFPEGLANEKETEL